jgi:hypothetical protein
MGCPREDGPISEQKIPFLSATARGLELRRTCASEGRSAYLMAAARAQIALQQPFTLSAALVETFSTLCGHCCTTRPRGYRALPPGPSPTRALGLLPTRKGSSVHTPLPIASTPSCRPLMPPPPMACASTHAYSVFPARRHQLGSTPCPSPKLSGPKWRGPMRRGLHSLAALPGYQCDACQHPSNLVHVRFAYFWGLHRPRHAMLRPGRTDHAVPRHPRRDFALCSAPGRHRLDP